MIDIIIFGKKMIETNVRKLRNQIFEHIFVYGISYQPAVSNLTNS